MNVKVLTSSFFIPKDACGVCGGDDSSCAGCDGVANSGTINDACGVCGGDGTSCNQWVNGSVPWETITQQACKGVLYSGGKRQRTKDLTAAKTVCATLGPATCAGVYDPNCDGTGHFYLCKTFRFKKKGTRCVLKVKTDETAVISSSSMVVVKEATPKLLAVAFAAFEGEWEVYPAPPVENADGEDEVTDGDIQQPINRQQPITGTVVGILVGAAAAVALIVGAALVAVAARRRRNLRSVELVTVTDEATTANRAKDGAMKLIQVTDETTSQGAPAASAASVASAASAGWREAVDPDSGHLYYYNDVTEESSWEVPDDYVPPATATPARTRGLSVAEKIHLRQGQSQGRGQGQSQGQSQGRGGSGNGRIDGSEEDGDLEMSMVNPMASVAARTEGGRGSARM